jgi:riboflavin kinase/FMN adenylyltransferase
VELFSFLRPEAKFGSLDALKAQMAQDCAEARRRLALHPRTNPPSC